MREGKQGSMSGQPDNSFSDEGFESPNTAMLNTSQRQLSSVSLSSPYSSQTNYVPLSHVLPQVGNLPQESNLPQDGNIPPVQYQQDHQDVRDENQNPYPMNEMTQCDRPRGSRDGHYQSVEQDPKTAVDMRRRSQGAMNYNSPLDRLPSAVRESPRSSSQPARRPDTLTINNQQYVTLEAFQRALNPVLSQDTPCASRSQMSNTASNTYSNPKEQRMVNVARNLAGAFRDNAPLDDDDDDNDERTITVQECLQAKPDEMINTTCVCYVIELETEQPLHPLVVKPRRKLCVGDSTGVMVGYIKRSQPVHFEKGNTLRLYGFTMRNGQFLVHANTSAST